MSVKKGLMTSFVILILLVLLVVLVGRRLFYHDYYSEVVISNDIVLSSDWTEIDTGDRVQVSKDNQFISLVLEPPSEPDSKQKGIKMPSGQVITPEIKLIDEQEKEYPLEYQGGRRHEGKVMVNYTYISGLPHGKLFRKLRIRSAHPLTVRQVIWSGYNTEDLP